MDAFITRVSVPILTENDEIYANCIKGYLGEIKELKSQNESFRIQNVELNKILMAMRQTHKDVIDRNSCLEYSNKELTANLSNAKKCLEDAKDSVENLINKNNQVQMIHEELIKVKKENFSLTSQNKNLIGKYNACKIELKDIKIKFSEYKSKYDTVIRRLHKSQSNEQKFMSLTKELHNKQEKYNDSKEMINKMKNKIQSSNTALSEMKNDLESKNRHILSLKKKNRSYKEKIKKSNEFLSIISSLKTQNEELEKECNSLKESLIKSKSNETYLQQHYNSEISRQKEKIDQLIQEYSNQIQQQRNLIEKITKSRNKIKDELKNTKSNAKIEANKFAQSLSTNYQSYKNQIISLQSKITDCENIIIGLRNQLQNSPSIIQYDSLVLQNNELKYQLNEFKKGINTSTMTQNEMTDYSNTVSKQKEEIMSLRFELEKSNQTLSLYCQKIEKLRKKYKESKANPIESSKVLDQTLEIINKKDQDALEINNKISNLKHSTSEILEEVNKSFETDLNQSRIIINALTLENQELRNNIKYYQEQSSFISEMKSKIDGIDQMTTNK